MFGKKSKAVVAGLSLVMALAPAVPAFAADGDAATTTTTPQITKVLKLNEGSTVDATFTFTAEKTTLNILKDGKATGEKTASDGPALDIANATFSAKSEKAGDNTTTADITLKSGQSYKHAGVYAWYVTETKGNVDGVQYNTDNNEYTLVAYVSNPDTTKGEKDYKVTYEFLKGKVTDLGGNKGDGKFTNKYTESANGTGDDLTIEKKVTGATGDKSKAFAFTVQFSAPEVLPAGQTAEQYLAAINCDKGTNDGKGGFTFNLKDGEKATFSNVIAGTKYSVTETAVDGYKQSYAAVNNGTAATTTSGNLIGEKANTGVMTNEHNEVTPTGIVLNNMPFIVMAGAAVAGVAAYGAAKRKLEK